MVGHKNNTIYEETLETLKSMCSYGTSKHNDKKNHCTQDKIYSYSTFKTYKNKCMDFIRFARKEYKCKSLEEARPYVSIFLKEKIDKNYSSWTIKLYACALGKLYQEPSNTFINIPRRERINIKRSRNIAIRDKHFSIKRNATLIEFARACGLRRSELENLRAKDCYERDGKWYVYVNNGKGGKTREVECIDLTQKCIEKIKATPPNKRIWGKCHSAADIHGYRSDYANAIYNKYARPIANIPKEERYICRKDKRKTIYDVRAMKICSQNLGHSRIEVIAYSYLRNKKDQ